MNYYSEIKKELINNEAYKKVKDYSANRNELETYYRVGKLLIEAQGGETRAKYGDGLIKEYSEKLVNDVGKKYDITTLKRMRQFYLIIQKGATLSHQLTWSHYVELLKFSDFNIINYYKSIVIEQNLSVRDLRYKIKFNEYERLDDKSKQKMINKEKLDISDNLKHPIKIVNTYDTKEINEAMLKQLILNNTSKFMKELGRGFSFIDSEYKIKIVDRYNYIDLLLFNIDFNCYVVIELKVTELKKEYIGQIKLYMNYIDKEIKKMNHDKTIGIIIAKRDNKFVMEYCSDMRIFRTTYELV